MNQTIGSSLIDLLINLGFFVVSFGILLFSIIAHELAHALAAYWCGDPTAKEQGRFSLNPLMHLDPIGSLALPIFLLSMKIGAVFGYAKPVVICRYNFKHPRRDMLLVAVAGPLVNALLLLSFLGILALHAVLPLPLPLMIVAKLGLTINLALMFFNLLPIPPLDGGHFLLYPLPLHLQDRYYKYISLASIIFIIMLLRSNIVSTVIMTMRNFLLGLV